MMESSEISHFFGFVFENELEIIEKLDFNEIVRWAEKESTVIKLELLNSFEVLDFSCFGSELEYVLAQLTYDDLEKLYDAGFTEKQVRDALGDCPDDMLIDLSILALNCCDEVYWSKKTGFVEEPQP